MADDETTGATDETTTGDETTEPAAVDHKAEAEKWKALSRKHETQAKANAEAARKLKELEDADKSESDKLRATAEENEKKAAAAEARALRLEVAAEKGLTPAQAKRLVGATREELEADADELLSTFKPADTGGASDTGGRPREALRGGTTSAGEEKELSTEEALKRIHPIS